MKYFTTLFIGLGISVLTSSVGAEDLATVNQLDVNSKESMSVTEIEKPIKTETPKVIVYGMPSCPYCVQAKNLLSQQAIPFEEINVMVDKGARKSLVDKGYTSVPQIFIGDTRIGGYDDLVALHESGGLRKLLQ